MTDRDDNTKKVVDLADARRRQRTLQGATKGAKKKFASGKPESGTVKGATGKVWGVIQVLIFLVMVAYLMQLCRAG